KGLLWPFQKEPHRSLTLAAAVQYEARTGPFDGPNQLSLLTDLLSARLILNQPVGLAGKAAGKVVAKVEKARPAYVRPPHATDRAQKAAVQGQPCVTCGKVAPKMVADHKVPLVVEHHRTGAVDRAKMHDVKAVQPQCPTCSSRQGAELKNTPATYS